jgi:hypothetical protein
LFAFSNYFLADFFTDDFFAAVFFGVAAAFFAIFVMAFLAAVRVTVLGAAGF